MACFNFVLSELPGNIVFKRPLADAPGYCLRKMQSSTLRADADLLVSKLQNQFTTLAEWQRLRGVKPVESCSPIVGTLLRLQYDAGVLATNVAVRIRVTYPWVAKVSCIPATAHAASSKSAAATLATSMSKYMILRLDDDNGPVNRATAQLGKAAITQEHSCKKLFPKVCEINNTN